MGIELGGGALALLGLVAGLPGAPPEPAGELDPDELGVGLAPEGDGLPGEPPWGEPVLAGLGEAELLLAASAPEDVPPLVDPALVELLDVVPGAVVGPPEGAEEPLPRTDVGSVDPVLPGGTVLGWPLAEGRRPLGPGSPPTVIPHVAGLSSPGRREAIGAGAAGLELGVTVAVAGTTATWPLAVATTTGAGTTVTEGAGWAKAAGKDG